MLSNFLLITHFSSIFSYNETTGFDYYAAPTDPKNRLSVNTIERAIKWNFSEIANEYCGSFSFNVKRFFRIYTIYIYFFINNSVLIKSF